MASTITSSGSVTTAAVASGQINFTGLGNGTDFNALIDGLVKAEGTRTTQLTAWKQQWTDKVAAFQTLNTRMLSLKTTLDGMDTMDTFMVKAVSSTDTSALSASADSTAQVSTHSVIIGQLAQNDILTTASGVSALTSVVTNSNTNITLSYAGASFTLSNVSAGTTLTGLVNYINNSALTVGKIKATTIFDGTVYHLQVYGMGQGDANKVVMSNTGSLVFQPAAFTETQKAQSAHIKVDGYPLGAANWLSRNSNTVADVVPGITMNLRQANSNASLLIGVSTDTAAIKQNIQNFVSQINQVRTMIQAMSKVDTTTPGSPQGALLTGNYGVQLIDSQLKDVVADKALGFSYYTALTSNAGSGDIFSSLSQLGIKTDADESSPTSGQLIVDDAVLSAALANNPDAVAKLFAASNLGESTSPNFSFLGAIGGTTKPGNYNVSIITSGAGISSATINGHPAAIDGWKITGSSGFDEAGLVVQLDNHSLNSTLTGLVNLKQGKAGEMSDKLKALTSTTDGPLHILQENYGDITKDIDTKIASETTRIANYKAMLQDKFSRLDTLLGTLNQQQTQLTSSIAQLSK